MPFGRIALVTPRKGREVEAEKLLAELVAFASRQPGFVRGYMLRPDAHGANAPRMGRVCIWENEQTANQVASSAHYQALQSELKLVVDDETHEEHSFLAEECAPL